MAPTNLARSSSSTAPKTPKVPRRWKAREVLIRAGGVAVRARLFDTPTADRVWSVLPIYSSVETWGDALHFETRAESGREAEAPTVIKAGEIAYWCERDRIIIAWGPTPLSRAAELRLPAPSNVWAVSLDNVEALAVVKPGEQVAVLVAES